MRLGVDGPEFVHGLPEHVHHAPQRFASDGNCYAFSQVVRFHSAHQTFGWLQRHRAHAVFAKVLLHLANNVDGVRDVVAFAGNAQRVENLRQRFVAIKFHVHHRPDDLHDVPDCGVFLCHSSLLTFYALQDAPLTTSIISFVMAAWRILFICNVSDSIKSYALFVAASMAVMRAACSAADESASIREILASTSRG